MVLVLRASTIYASTRYRAQLAGYISTPRVKGKSTSSLCHRSYRPANMDRFQQLELKHVPDRGCFAAMEFR